MSNNPDSENEAFQEGRIYFDDPNCKNKKKYKHCICSFNTAYWWFRDKDNKKSIITDEIISDEYLKNIIPIEIEKTRNLFIYYFEISDTLNINSIINKYKKYDVHFIKICKKPSENIIFKTVKGKTIKFHTICLIDSNTVIFDVKNFGIMKETNGKNMRVYRIKDKEIYKELFKQFLRIQKK